MKAFAARLKQRLVTLHLAARDPRTPWYAKAFAACVLAYAVSPIDLIPDVIPILGYLDDLVLIPLGIYLAIRLIPPEILAECRTRAAEMDSTLPHSRKAAVVIVLIWLLIVLLAGYFLMGLFSL